MVSEITTQSSEISKLASEFKANPDNKEESKKRGQEILKRAEEFAKRKVSIQKEVDRLSEERRKFSERRFTHIGESMQLFTLIPKHLSPLIDEITMAMKSELGLPLDERWYMNEMKKMLADALKLADGWIERLNATNEQKQWIRAGAHSDSAEKTLNQT